MPSRRWPAIWSSAIHATRAPSSGPWSRRDSAIGWRATSASAAMKVRREVLGDAHVDRAIASTTPFTKDFQDYITRAAWGDVWTRPGLDRRMRSAITISVLVARGHWDELAMHIKAARRNGLSEEEISEILLQLAVYASIPSANQAFHIAQKALAETDEDAPRP